MPSYPLPVGCRNCCQLLVTWSEMAGNMSLTTKLFEKFKKKNHCKLNLVHLYQLSLSFYNDQDGLAGHRVQIFVVAHQAEPAKQEQN